MTSYADQIKTLMVDRGLKLSVAESITSGNIQAAIGSVSGASKYFEGGMTVYTREQKVAHLGVDDEHAREVNSVSARVAQEMARGVCLKFRTDVGVGTTGYAEADRDENVLVPNGYFAIWHESADHKGKLVVAQHVTGEGLGRVEMQQRLTVEVLKELLRYLQSLTRDT